MLYVEISLWPAGDQDGAGVIGRAAIANVDGLDVCDYLVVTDSEHESPHAFMIREHRRDAGFWELLRRVVEAHESDDELHAVPEDYAELVALLSRKLEQV